ncbi:MAG: Tetratricopeptide domain protein [Fibrobacteres bacterium]|nr:Tetratricopeptide domain protein [Fibrobacterota bacterium]
MRHSERPLILLAIAILITAAASRADSTAEEKASLSEKSLGSESNPSYHEPDLQDGYHLYLDLSEDQSELAHLALSQAYSANIQRARKSVAALRAMETAKHLPPLSYLLSVAIDVMRYQNGDYEDEEEEKALLKSIDDASEQGSYLCKRALDKEPDHPTFMLILGGIRGFSATLKIHGNPSQAMGDGFQALKLLERSRGRDSRIKDSYMGTGIFNCTAANAPLFVRATLKIIGRSVTMKAGLEALRVSAYKGQYTSVSSQLFLIQFLTPYDQELVREKREIFRSLESSFPRNPYYTFLKTDEALCFYPDSFYSHSSRTALASRITAFASQDFTSRRYGNLVRFQYTLLDPSPDKRYAPDTSFQFRDYEFYPAFIEALRFKRATEDTLGTDEKPPKAAILALKALRDSTIELISNSPMNPTRKRYYQWHVTDALRWPSKQGRILPAEESTTSR